MKKTRSKRLPAENRAKYGMDGKNRKCNYCGKTYTVSEEIHRQFCEVLNPNDKEEET